MTPERASLSSCASSSLSSTTSRPPPSVGIRMTSLRCSRTTSIGPSPVRVFIAAIIIPFYPPRFRDASGPYFTGILRVVANISRSGVIRRSVDRVLQCLRSVVLGADPLGQFGIHAVPLQSVCLEYLVQKCLAFPAGAPAAGSAVASPWGSPNVDQHE